MKSLMNSWLALLRTTSELNWYAPLVIQQRSARLIAAPRPLPRAEQREASRMVSEKMQAGAESQFELWLHASRLQQQLVVDFWTGALARRAARPTSAAAWRRSSADANRLARRLMLPAHRRVKANARRLSTRR